MGDRTGPACLYARERRLGIRFAWVTVIFQFLFLFGDNHGYRFIPNGVVRIFIHHPKDVGWASWYAIPTSVALVRVDGNEEIS